MVNYLNDGALVGFWPLNEPSGAPLWKNYSSAFARHPSGISFDFTVAVADLPNLEEYMSPWPGLGYDLNKINCGSGSLRTGYQVRGHWKLKTDSSPLSKYLILGGGSSRAAQQIWQPAVANSGFTVGFWVYPNSDGYENFQNSANLVSYSWETEAARCHTLVGAFQATTNDAGWRMGISGLLSRGAQNNFDYTSSKQLTAFAFIEQAAGAATDTLRVPIESGMYTHLTYTFRYINGTSNQVVLYKNGRVAASGNTSANLTASNTNLISSSLARTLTIGASDDASTATDDYERTSGWNHLISGVYFFKRVLHEGEILHMHESEGGMQPDQSYLLPAVETKLTSDYLVGYYPFMEPGYADISNNQRPLISSYDAAGSTENVFCPGPYKYGGIYNNGSATENYHALSSGTCYDLLENRSWTIGTWLSLQNTTSRDNNIFMSWGSTTALTLATSQVSSSTLTGNTAGIIGTVSGIANQQRAVIEIYPLGNIKQTLNKNLVFNLTPTFEYYNQAHFHIALAYDDSTKGVAAYVNGVLAESGTLSDSLTDQLLSVTGLGYPLIFGNGVIDTITDTTVRGLHGNGGADNWLGPAFLANKALVQPEIRGIVLSGIVDIDSIYLTRHDPRLVAYWPCSSYTLSDTMILDEARVWNQVPGHLIRGDTFGSDERWYDRDGDEGIGVFRPNATAYIDHFGSRTTPPELASYGNLGITSGVFIANGGSIGLANVTDSDRARSSYTNTSVRYKPVIEERDLRAQNLAGEYVVSFEVTPSGNIPKIDLVRTSATNAINTNCLLFSIGNHAITPAAGDYDYHCFLTSINSTNPDPLGFDAGLGGSGIIIRVDGSEDALPPSTSTHTPLVSGRIAYGIPSQVLIHTKFNDPYETNAITNGQASMTINLWINGTLIQSREITQNLCRIWSDGAIDSASDSTVVQFGGVLGNDTLNNQPTWQGGLGEIFMREIFIMKGVFNQGEISNLASNGIQSVSIAGYTDQKPTTQVTKADIDLQGYWRFNGFDGGKSMNLTTGGGSGTTDLSFKENHLFPAAQAYAEKGGVNTQSAVYLRMAPAMFANSSYGIQCSGVTYSSRQISTVAHSVPLYMASGTGFNSPDQGFSVGFYLKKKAVVALNRFDAILAYGIVPTNDGTITTDTDYGWVIGTDENDVTKIVISTNGNMYLDSTDNAAMAGQISCGVYGEFNGKSASQDNLTIFDRKAVGDVTPPKLDTWAHYCWTYDNTTKTTKCYLNGELVDSVTKLNDTPQIPADEWVRYITFLQHSTAPWTFNTTSVSDFDSVLTDVFYFSRSLQESEVRYIALNGIDNAFGTQASGLVGGYVYGQDVGSGLLGGYSRGQDIGSGLVGGFLDGSIVVSGLVGGYVFGQDFATSGILGGFTHGIDTMSGVFAGYIRGLDKGSGLIGGYVLGGLQGYIDFDAGYRIYARGAEDFDARLTVEKTSNTDFDAKLVVFQNELPPLVDILIPGTSVSGLSIPFNQYFVGAASGRQGKQITYTRWSFGDFTPAVSVPVSGSTNYPNTNLFPHQHYFASSGYYIVRFEAYDENGMHASATRIINAASGIEPVIISLSGVPRSGNAGIIVDFNTTIHSTPNGVSISSKLLQFDDGQSSTLINPTHTYNEPGVYKPIWCVRDSRGVTWSDGLDAGSDYLIDNGQDSPFG